MFNDRRTRRFQIAWVVLTSLLSLAPYGAEAQSDPQSRVSSSPTPVVVPNTPTTTQYNPSNGFPDHNGAFSAMLVVIPDQELSEFDKPSGSARQLDRVSRAEPGAVLAVKIVFVGMMTDWQKNADVTYDLQVYGPDGKIYGKSDYKGLLALHDRVIEADGAYDNKNAIVKLEFEPNDLPGLYKIKAVLHDRVGQLDVPLTGSVELVEKPVAVATSSAQAANPSATVVSETTPTAAPARTKKRHRRLHHH